MYIDYIILQSLSPKQSISMLTMELRPKKLWHFPNEFSQKRVISILFFPDLVISNLWIVYQIKDKNSQSLLLTVAYLRKFCWYLFLI